MAAAAVVRTSRTDVPSDLVRRGGPRVEADPGVRFVDADSEALPRIELRHRRLVWREFAQTRSVRFGVGRLRRGPLVASPPTPAVHRQVSRLAKFGRFRPGQPARDQPAPARVVRGLLTVHTGEEVALRARTPMTGSTLRFSHEPSPALRAARLVRQAEVRSQLLELVGIQSRT